jgi:hypothetical protein
MKYKLNVRGSWTKRKSDASNLHLILRVYVKMSVIHAIEADLGSITFKYNRLHYNYFAIFMITLQYDYINFQM